MKLSTALPTVKIASIIVSIAFVGLAAFFAGRLLPEGRSATLASPAFVPVELDLGDVPWSSYHDLNLLFRNLLPTPVLIKRVSTSCGCTAPKGSYEGRSVAAGGSIDVAFTIDTRKSAGEKVRTISLELESGIVAQAIIRLNVIASHRFDPNPVNMGSVVLAAEPPHPMAIEFLSDSDSLTGALHPTAEWFSATRDERNGRRILIQAIPERMRPGLNVATLVVGTDSVAVPDAAVTVRAVGVRALQVLPQSLMLAVGESGTASIHSATGTPVGVHRVVAPDGVDVVVRDDGVSLAISLTAAAPVESVVQIYDIAGHVARVRVARSGAWE